jgi:hypothetical protein
MMKFASGFGLYVLGMVSMRLLSYLFAQRRAARLNKGSSKRLTALLKTGTDVTE